MRSLRGLPDGLAFAVASATVAVLVLLGAPWFLGGAAGFAVWQGVSRP